MPSVSCVSRHVALAPPGVADATGGTAVALGAGVLVGASVGAAGAVLVAVGAAVAVDVGAAEGIGVAVGAAVGGGDGDAKIAGATVDAPGAVGVPGSVGSRPIDSVQAGVSTPMIATQQISRIARRRLFTAPPCAETRS